MVVGALKELVVGVIWVQSFTVIIAAVKAGFDGIIAVGCRDDFSINTSWIVVGGGTVIFDGFFDDD